MFRINVNVVKVNALVYTYRDTRTEFQISLDPFVVQISSYSPPPQLFTTNGQRITFQDITSPKYFFSLRIKFQFSPTQKQEYFSIRLSIHYLHKILSISRSRFRELNRVKNSPGRRKKKSPSRNHRHNPIRLIPD